MIGPRSRQRNVVDGNRADSRPERGWAGVLLNSPLLSVMLLLVPGAWPSYPGDRR
jgi:hypothetical protein